jgi:SAM-dependent methyltransferase
MLSDQRAFDRKSFDSAYQTYVCNGQFQEDGDYYPRYVARYRDLLKIYASLVPSGPQRVLDVGGGQLALLSSKIWSDEGHVADIGGAHLDYLSSVGLTTYKWNLCEGNAPFQGHFDVIFFSEVVEHLPIPAHVVFQRLRSLLMPGGLLICTTPNLYRLRNVIYMACGIQIFDYFRMPTDKGLGHVVEYSADHLAWQLEEAGFKDVSIRFHNIAHSPINPVFRALYWLGKPLLLFPRFRDCLIATARK